jgi:hypothetical protein
MSLELQRELGGPEYYAALYPHARIQFADYLVSLNETDDEIRTLAETVALDDSIPWDHTGLKNADVEMSMELRTKMRKKEIDSVLARFPTTQAIRFPLIDKVALIMNNSEWYVLYDDIKRHAPESLLQYAFEILRTTRDYTIRVIRHVAYFIPVHTIPLPNEEELVAYKQSLERSRTYLDPNHAIEDNAQHVFECTREGDHVTVTYPTPNTERWYEQHMRLVRASSPA